MLPDITRHLSQTVYVSIPALFEDGLCRPYKLLGVELNGLWLQSDELTGRLLPSEAGHLAECAPAVFVPLAQIAGVLIATTIPEFMYAAPTSVGATTPAQPAQGTSQKPRQSGRRRSSNRIRAARVKSETVL
jgi:hypothetical protein